MSAAPPHLYTLTCNLLAERTLEFPAWSAGRTQRAAAESFQVGGKGINVAKMLTRLRVANTALCFLGGAPGAECEAWLQSRRLAFRGFATSVPTRSGTVVRDRSRQHDETTFLGPDAPADPAAIRACAAFLDAQPDGRVLAFCGSAPGWSSADFAPLRAALRRWLGRGVLVVDTYGPPLLELAAWPVHLVKINADECRAAGLAPRGSPASRWVVTNGGNPVWLRDQDGTEATVTPPAVSQISATGSGDVLLACLLQALFVRGESLYQAVNYALPFAAANAAHPGVAEFEWPGL